MLLPERRSNSQSGRQFVVSLVGQRDASFAVGERVFSDRQRRTRQRSRAAGSLSQYVDASLSGPGSPSGWGTADRTVRSRRFGVRGVARADRSARAMIFRTMSLFASLYAFVSGQSTRASCCWPRLMAAG
jgi:hypothetical protein